jgi:peptide/nickel transport system substrate-binding protein
LKAIGVQVTQKNLDASAAFDAIGAPNYTYKNFDLAIWDWIMLPDPDFALSVVTCAEYGNWSDTGYCNPAYDKLYALQGTQTNLQDRINTVYKMQEILNRDRPYIILGYQNWVSAYAKNWTGFADTIQGPVNALSVDGLVDPHKT